MSYAYGKKAWGECAKCGRRVLLHKLISDGYNPNLQVEPLCYDPPYEPETLPPIDDPIQVADPSPSLNRIGAIISFPNYNLLDKRNNNPLNIGLHFGVPEVKVV